MYYTGDFVSFPVSFVSFGTAFLYLEVSGYRLQAKKVDPEKQRTKLHIIK